MYDYINGIHYLLPRLNDLAYGIKKSHSPKANSSIFQSIKKGTSHTLIITYSAMKRKETSHNVQKNL